MVEVYPEWLDWFDVGMDDDGNWIGCRVEPYVECVGYADDGEAIMVEMP